MKEEFNDMMRSLETTHEAKKSNRIARLRLAIETARKFAIEGSHVAAILKRALSEDDRSV